MQVSKRLAKLVHEMGEGGGHVHLRRLNHALLGLDDGIGRLIFDAALAVFGHPALNAHKAIFTPLGSPRVLHLSGDSKQKKQSMYYACSC